MRRLAALFALAAFAATTVPALADPAGDLKAAFAKIMAVKSYRTSMTMANGMVANGTAVNPGRYDTTVNGMEIMMIGDTTYMHIGGKWSKSTASGGAAGEMPMAQKYAQIPPGAILHDLGMRTVAGEALHAYSVQRSADAPVVTIFIDGHGLPVRVEVPSKTGMTAMRFYDFNAPISINAPI